MSRGNRGVITAIGFVAVSAIGIGWFTFPEPPSLKPFEYDQPRNERYQPGGSECASAALASIRDAKVRVNRADACAKEAEEYRQSADDLIQQTRAANAAEAQTSIASQMLWMGWFQTVGGLITLAAAIAAAIYARSAAIESRRAANIASDSHNALVSAERAIIRVKEVRLVPTKDATDIVVMVENYGRCSGVVNKSTYFANPMKLLPSVGYLDNLTDQRALVAQGQKDVYFIIGAEQFDTNKPWFVSGIIGYETILAKFESTFCWEFVWRDDGYTTPQWIGTKIAQHKLPQDT